MVAGSGEKIMKPIRMLAIAGLLALSLAGAAFAADAKPPFEDHYVDANGQHLHYVTVGKGPMVLFLHGYPSFWYQWKDQMLAVSGDHMAVALDLRGYNLSSRPVGLDNYKMPLLVEDIKQFADKVNGKDKKFVLVIHDWGATLGWVFSMFHPEMLEKLIVVNGAQAFLSEREFHENPAQRYYSNYMLVMNGYLAPGEKPMDENNNTVEAATARAHTGFVDAEVRKGHYTEADRQMWIDAWSQPGSTTAGLAYYRANHRNPPFNATHPASMVTYSWDAKAITKGAKSVIVHVPTLAIWGLKDMAVGPGHLDGLQKWAPDLHVKLYPNDDHWVMLEHYKEVGEDMRQFIADDKSFPRESAYDGK
jgi:pimeloyl-ACP methyl ester carboxylesterase